MAGYTMNVIEPVASVAGNSMAVIFTPASLARGPMTVIFALARLAGDAMTELSLSWQSGSRPDGGHFGTCQTGRSLRARRFGLCLTGRRPDDGRFGVCQHLTCSLSMIYPELNPIRLGHLCCEASQPIQPSADARWDRHPEIGKREMRMLGARRERGAKLGGAARFLSDENHELPQAGKIDSVYLTRTKTTALCAKRNPL